MVKENNFFEIPDHYYGEIYHLAMHAILNPFDLKNPLKVLLKRDFSEFLDDLGIEFQTVKEKQSKYQDLGKTATAIINYYDSDQQKIVEAKCRILKLAESENWMFPYVNLATPDQKILIWNRNISYMSQRNSSVSLTHQLAEMAIKRGALPVIIGCDRNIAEYHPLGNFYEDAFFKSGHSVCKQLWFQHMLFTSYGVKVSVGMKSGAMDGAAMFFGHKTIFFAKHKDVKKRMAKVAKAVPALHWFKTEYGESFAKLDEQQLNELEEKIWPTF